MQTGWYQANTDCTFERTLSAVPMPKRSPTAITSFSEIPENLPFTESACWLCHPPHSDSGACTAHKDKRNQSSTSSIFKMTNGAQRNATAFRKRFLSNICLKTASTQAITNLLQQFLSCSSYHGFNALFRYFNAAIIPQTL